MKVLYRHVDILNHHGYKATILHRVNKFRCDWFQHNTKITYCKTLAALKMEPSDYLVIPEIYGPKISMIRPGIKKIIFNQNAYYTFTGYSLDTLITPYKHPDIAGTLVVSEDSRRYLRQVYPGLPVHRVWYSVDPSVFYYDWTKKKRQICFMPRKLPTDAMQVVNILKFRGVLKNYKVIPIEGRHENDVAKILRESILLFHFGYQEGLPLPCLEAMASGCLVIGYHGQGGKELLRTDFSFPIEAGNVIRFARTAERVLAMHQETPGIFRQKVKRSMAYVQTHYSREKEINSVLSFWRQIIR